MTGAGSIRRLWLVDHLLRDDVGHHAGYNAALGGAAERAGVQAVVVGHRDLSRRGLRSFRTIAHFRTDWRAQPPAWIAGNRRLLGMLEALCANRFAGDLRNFPELPESGDFVFAQMIAPRHLLAWTDWLAGHPEPPILALHLGYQPWRFERPDLRRAMNLLPSSASSNLRFVTDSEKLAGPFGRALGRRVRHLPHVVETVFPQAVPGRPGKPPVIFAAGNARREKGFADLLHAVVLLVPKLESVGFVVHAQCHSPDPFCAELLERVVVPAGVTLLADGLANDSYVAAIAGADVIVLPYHLDHYALRTSGVFCEARCAGRPVIATKGSWAGDRVEREGGGWVVPEKNPEALAAAIAHAAGPDLAAKASEAAALQEAARREFSPDGFVQSLLGEERGES